MYQNFIFENSFQSMNKTTLIKELLQYKSSGYNMIAKQTSPNI